MLADAFEHFGRLHQIGSDQVIQKFHSQLLQGE